MLHLIPAPLHRTALRVAHGLRKVWWRWRGPSISGCRVLALDPAGRVLLIRHSYGTGKWMPPGGGLKRGEEPVAAGIRELSEETGCTLDDAVEVALVEEDLHGARNRVHVIAGRIAGLARADGREAIAAEFHAPDALPDDMADALRQQLPGWVERYRDRAATGGSRFVSSGPN